MKIYCLLLSVMHSSTSPLPNKLDGKVPNIHVCREHSHTLNISNLIYFEVLHTIIQDDSYDKYTRKIMSVSILWFERSMLLTYFNPQHTRDLNFTSICACAESCVALTACTAYNCYKSNSLQIFFNIIGIEICQKSNVG